MAYENALPEKFPEPGFYYHYKHDPAGPVNGYAYEVLGVGHHTEDDCRPMDANMLVYRPLYEAFVYTHGKMFDLRPLHMFFETAQKDGKTVQRFQKVEDPAAIKELTAIRDRMYGN
jgi:hypothetical protein